MIRCGLPPYLECSSRGDVRFSAFHARPRSLKGRTIEEAYQAMKVFDFSGGTTGLHWKIAKRLTQLRVRILNLDECHAAYRVWWREWVTQQGLLPDLRAAAGLSDTFGQEGHICQAAVLWDIRNES